jgi:hypothetical protein
MVTIDVETARLAIATFKRDLKNLTHKDGNKHKSKACLICDRLLEWNDTGIITVVRLKKLREHFLGQTPIFEGIHPALKSYYAYHGNGSGVWTHDMYLSPRGCYCSLERGFQCCIRCEKVLNTNEKPYRIKLP